MNERIRMVGFGILAVVAVAAYIVLAPRVVRDEPTLPSATQYESLISSALSDFELNNRLADSAPQQQVVNGWVTRDLLTIVAKEMADVLRAQGAVVDATGNLQTQPFDERIPALLLLGVLAIVWAQVSRPQPATAAAQPPAPLTEDWSAQASA